MTTDKKSGPAGDMADRVEAEQAVGYLGVGVDPHPNSAYSLESGPDSPAPVEDDHTRLTLP